MHGEPDPICRFLGEDLFGLVVGNNLAPLYRLIKADGYLDIWDLFASVLFADRAVLMIACNRFQSAVVLYEHFLERAVTFPSELLFTEAAVISRSLFLKEEVRTVSMTFHSPWGYWTGPTTFRALMDHPEVPVGK